MDKSINEIPSIEEQENSVADTENIYENFTKEESHYSRHKKKRRKKHYFMRLLIVLILIGGAIFAMSLPYFDIKEITVEGNSGVSTEEVIKDSQIEVGENIFLLNKRQVIKRMKSNSYYSTIKISKKLPDKIVIKVVERTPMAVLPYGDRYVILNESGIVLGLSDENPQLTVIDGITIKNMDKGEVVDAKETENFTKDLELLALMNESDLFFKSIDVDGTNVVCHIYENLLVKGSYEDVVKNMKNGNLQNIIYDLYKKEIKRGTITIDGDEYCSFSPTF